MFLRNNKCTLTRVFQSQRIRQCSAKVENDVVEEKVERDEDKITRLTNVSRLPVNLRGRMKHILEPCLHETHPDYISQLRRKKYFKNLLHASYGRKSGIDPSYFWMNEEELKKQKEFEEEWEPPLQAKLQAVKEEEESERLEMLEKDEIMVASMKKMPGLIKEFQSKLQKETDKERDMQKKKDILLQEARDFFGYNISPHDPRFEQMKLQKEEEEKKGKKLVKKNKNIESSR